jgi:hypothetical protein
MHAARKRLHVTCFVNNKQQQQVGGKVIVGRKPSGPPVLIKEEQQSLQAALKAAGLPADAIAADIPKDAVRAVLSTIRKGLDKKEEDLPKLEGAMLLAEQLFHATRGNMMAAAGVQETEPQAVDVWQVKACSALHCSDTVLGPKGTWRLCKLSSLGVQMGAEPYLATRAHAHYLVSYGLKNTSQLSANTIMWPPGRQACPASHTAGSCTLVFW